MVYVGSLIKYLYQEKGCGMSNLDNSICRELIMEIDGLGNIIAVSDNCYNILGYNTNEIINLNIKQLILGGNTNFLEEEQENYNLTLIDKNKRYKHFEVLIHRLRDRNNIINGAKLSLISQDGLTKEKTQDFLKILELSREIIYMVELEPKLKMTYINPAVKEKLGISVEENYKNPMRAFEAAHIDDRHKFITKISNKLDYSDPIQMRYKHINGEYFWFEESVIPIYNEKNKLIALTGFCRDIQERKMMEEDLKKISFYDSLTGIKNRRYFEKEMNELNVKTNKEIGMIIFDLDNLKNTNDKLGHLQGDELLKQLAKILDKYTSEDIIAARIGGDEFILLIQGKSYEFVEEIYLDLLDSINKYNIKNQDIPIMVSIGLGYSKTSIGSTQSVYNIADARMYEDKANNKRSKIT